MTEANGRVEWHKCTAHTDCENGNVGNCRTARAAALQLFILRAEKEISRTVEQSTKSSCVDSDGGLGRCAASVSDFEHSR